MAIITISRGTFSGGKELAECVAARLGYPVVSREEIVSTSPWFGIPVEKLTATDQPPEFWNRLDEQRKAYMQLVQSGLCERGRTGNLVYHGHAAHILLPGVSHVLRVRVIADMEYRVQAAMRDQKLGRQEAEAYIEATDRERRDWVRFLYGVEWGDSSLYDLVLNLSHVSLEGACSTVAFMAKLEEFKPTPRSLAIMEELACKKPVST